MKKIGHTDINYYYIVVVNLHNNKAQKFSTFKRHGKKNNDSKIVFIILSECSVYTKNNRNVNNNIWRYIPVYVLINL